MTLADRIQLILQMRGLTATQLGDLAGLPTGEVEHLLNGVLGERAADTLEALARAARVTPSWLVSGAGQPEAYPHDFPPVAQLDLPGWAETVATLRHEHPYLAAEVIAIAGRITGIAPRGGMTASYLLDLVQFVQRHASPAHLEAARVLLAPANDAPVLAPTRPRTGRIAALARPGPTPPPAEERYIAAARRILRPERPRLARVLSVLLGRPAAPEYRGGRPRVRFCDQAEPREIESWSFTDVVAGCATAIRQPGEAWQTLSREGVLPRVWTERPQPEAMSLAVCVGLAADPDGIDAAEATAIEAVALLCEFGFPVPRRVTWQASRNGVLNVETEAKLGAVRQQVWNAGGVVLTWPQAAAAQRVAVQAGASKDAAACFVKDVTCCESWTRAYPNRPNPFAKLVALWECGYSLHRVTDDVLVLTLPDP